MNPLQCGKDGCTSGANKNYSVIDSISSSFWIVKRSKQSHETISSTVGYKIGLPFLEISDLATEPPFLINGMCSWQVCHLSQILVLVWSLSNYDS